MTPTQLLQHFDRLSEAPDAILRLRRFVLDLAVRGKLVEQDPNDEPAAELLKRIKIEKARLEKEGQGKKEKPLAPIEEEETPFLVPASWTWTRLQDITSYIQRGKSPIYASEDGLPVISQKCVQWKGLDISSARLITRESIKKYDEVRFLRENDLLWNSTGTGTIGRVVRVISPQQNLVCDSHVTVVRCALVNAEYVRSWLRSDHIYQLIEDRAAGSTNQVELTSQMTTFQVVPLPPLAEQHRIVAKVEELMALCDQLEAAKAEREQSRDRLLAANLHNLNQPADDEEAFREHVRFTFNHLPRITTRPAHIKQLRQTILNLAVRGKLVPQDPNDEPTSELLKRIQEEKTQLVKEGKIKNEKSLPQISELEKLFVLPKRWEWSRLRLIVFALGDGLHGTPTYAPGTNYYFINGNNLVDGKIVIKPSTKTVSFDEMQKHKKSMSSNTVLVSINGTLGSVAFYNNEQVVLGKSACYFNLSELIEKRFVKLVMESQYFIDYALQNATGTTIRNLSLKAMNEFPVPLPPLA